MREREISLLRLSGAIAPARRLRRRRPRRRCAVALAALGITALAGSEFVHAGPRLVWNASPSAPLGLYRVAHDDPLVHGALVLAALPESVRGLAAERGYLPLGVPLVKRVAALAGDTVCGVGASLTIDGEVVADRLAADRRGRPLPAWEGCRTLGATEVFLLMEGVPDSFDGRYFGAVEASSILGRLVPLWTW
jgi:conjugative transfer signal peptidase TraF